jgi:hypothetical protein
MQGDCQTEASASNYQGPVAFVVRNQATAAADSHSKKQDALWGKGCRSISFNLFCSSMKLLRD